MAETQFQILVVDDDNLVRETLRALIPTQWKAHILDPQQKIPDVFFHVALVDMHFTQQMHAEGLALIKTLREKNPHLEVIAMSGDFDRDLMEKSLRAGASRFLAKPLSPEEFELTLDKVESLLLLQQANRRSSHQKTKWIGQGQTSKNLLQKLASLKNESEVILLEGESGTGKEVIARLIYEQSNGGPFVAFNVAAIPENIFESELFGHVKGTFTGADQNKMGLIEAANGGVLFIDEIEALPLGLQVKLLRFLENGEIRRLGSKETLHINCRVVVATNKNLEEMVKAQTFREDLLWRIKSSHILLPPLRERKEDIVELSKYFLEKDNYRKKTLAPDAIEALCNHNWPGNVRELKRCCEQLLINSPLPIIRREDVTPLIKGAMVSATAVNEFNFDIGLNEAVKRFEAQLISKALEHFNDIEETAKQLQISRSSLYKKISDFEIEWRPS